MAMEKIELSAALQNLATQTNIDKVTGVYNGVPANIAKADLASVVAGVMGSKKLFPFMFRTVANDADTTVNSGIYRVNSTTLNVPYNYGLLVVFDTSDYVVQTLYRVTNHETWTRRTNLQPSSPTWTNWVRSDNFGYNTLTELAGGVAGIIGNVSNTTDGLMSSFQYKNGKHHITSANEPRQILLFSSTLTTGMVTNVHFWSRSLNGNYIEFSTLFRSNASPVIKTINIGASSTETKMALYYKVDEAGKLFVYAKIPTYIQLCYEVEFSSGTLSVDKKPDTTDITTLTELVYI